MPFKDEEFRNALELVIRNNKAEKLVICGDFNKTAFWITKILSQIKTDKIFRLIENNQTTHITLNKDNSENKKIYDHFLISGFDNEVSFKVEPLDYSDHFPISITL
jgi:endonuclease/exonuclease/phosphatase family metal-dependent hydrolase